MRDKMIAVLDCSRRFYAEAADKVDREDLKTLFLDLAHSREAMLEDLRSLPDTHNGQSDKDDLIGSLEKTYAEIRANWDVDKECRYLVSLVTSEDQILHAFGSAVVNSDSPPMRDVASKHLEALIRGHQRLLKLRYGQPAEH